MDWGLILKLELEKLRGSVNTLIEVLKILNDLKRLELLQSDPNLKDILP